MLVTHWNYRVNPVTLKSDQKVKIKIMACCDRETLQR